MFRKTLHLFQRLIDILVFCFLGGTRFAQRKGVQIGKGCRIYTSHFGSEPFLITIGNNVTITSGTSFVTHDGSAWLFRDDKGRRYTYSPITIGDEVFIGLKSTIMPGVKIGNRVIVAAGSVVTKSIPDGWIVGGVPAKKIGLYADYERKALAEFASEADMLGAENYKDRVQRGIKNPFKPYLEE